MNEYDHITDLKVEDGKFEDVGEVKDLAINTIAEDVTIEVLDEDGAEAESVRKRILELKDMVEDSNFELAEMLHRAYARSMFKHWKYNTWEEYCEQESCIGIRKANYLKKIWEWFAVKWGNDRELLSEVKKLGWTRAMMLTGILMPTTKEKWLPLARELSCKRLEEKIKEYRKEVKEGKVSIDEADEVDVKTKFKVDLYNDQIVTINNALERAQDLTSSDSKAVQLAAICQDFLSTNSWEKNSKDSLIAYFSKVEHLMGLKIIAVNPRNKEIVYGAAFMDDMINLEVKKEG